MPLTQKGKMMVAAHRGDSYNEFENTLPAFAAALTVGADMVETDVRMTKDGALILMHDAKVDRTTDGTGLVCEKTLEEMRALNAGNAVEKRQVPTFEELLTLLKDTSVTLNLEVKEYAEEGNVVRCEECIDKCVALIEQYGMAERMVFNSFDAYVLEYVAKKYDGKYMLHGFYPYNAMHRVTRNPDEYLYCACIWGANVPQSYEYLQSRGIEPWIGASFTRPADLKFCFDLGARLVTTNYPADALRKLEKLGARG